MKTLYVELGERSYPIHIGPGLFDRLPQYLREQAVPATDPLWMITDAHVDEHYGEKIQRMLQQAGYKVGKCVVQPGEASKSLAVFEGIVTDALKFGLDRNGVVLALGGGMVGDLAGFFAASYMRGIRFIQLPTTLLAHDSSVGGKVAVNHELAKNVIGAFYQPLAVIYDTQTLISLPRRELISGFAEVIKHGLIRDKALLDFLEKQRRRLIAVTSPEIDEAIRWGCRIKADVVSCDETEQGLRAILNYGHTIGHALEALSAYDQLTHGEAIAIGMVGAAMIGERLGYVEEDVVVRTRDMLASYGLPTQLPDRYSEEAILARMRHDKKNRSDRLTMVLPVAWGKVEIVSDVSDAVILEVLSEWKQTSE